MKYACAIPVYNRPRYLKQVVDGLVKCPEIQSGEVDLLFYIEPTDHQQANVDVINSSNVPASIIINDQHLGAEKSLIHTHRQPFDALGYDGVFQIQDDFVPNKYFFRVLMNLQKWSDKQGLPCGCFRSPIRCHFPRSIKKKRLGICTDPETGPYVAYLLMRNTWNQIRGFINEYDTKHLLYGDACQRRNTLKIFEDWANRCGLELSVGNMVSDHFDFERFFMVRRYDFLNDDPRKSSGHDACMGLAIRIAREHSLLLDVNRGLFVGSHGVNTTEDVFERHGYDRVVQDQFKEDAELVDFTLERVEIV